MEELKRIFAPYTALLTFYGGGDSVSFELGQENDIYINMDYLIRDGLNTIETIYISTQALQKVGDGFQREFKSPAYHLLFEAYSLSEILTAYGVPSKDIIKRQLSIV